MRATERGQQCTSDSEIVASREVNSHSLFIINYCLSYFGSKLDNLHSVDLRSSDFLIQL